MKPQMKTRFAPAMLALALASAGAYAQPAASQPRHDEHASTALTDGQILQIVRTLNDAEIEQAKEALDESKNANVKQVAQMILTDHEDSNEKVDELLKGDTSLDDSALNDTLHAKAEETHEALQDLEGAPYDCAYLQKQVAQHEEAINLSKTQLAPSASAAGLKQLLTAMGPKLEHHLQMAEQGLGKTAGCQ